MEQYEKGEKLGQGQFGVVIKARHRKVGEAWSFCKALLVTHMLGLYAHKL